MRRKGVLFWVVCMILLVSVGCSKETKKEKVSRFQDEERYLFMSNGAEAEDGVYHVSRDRDDSWDRIYYIDTKTSKKTVLCQKVNCKHDSKECLAAVEDSDTIGCVVYSDGKIYLLILERTEQGEGTLKLYSMSKDGAEKKLLHAFDGVEIIPNAAGLYKGKVFMSVQTMQKEEDGSGKFTAEPSIIMYDLETKKETTLIDGTKAKGQYTIPCGGSDDSVYLVEIPWNDADPNSPCTYLEYNFKTGEMGTIYETTQANYHMVVDDIVYLQSEGEKKLEKYNLRTKEKEVVLEWKEDVDSVFASGELIRLEKEEEVEGGGIKRHLNWYDLKEKAYLFDGYQDEDELWLYMKTDHGYFGRKDGEVGFYHLEDKSWEIPEEIK